MAWKCVKMSFSHWRQHPFSEWKSLKCNYLHNHGKISLTWFKPYCSHCMSPSPVSIPQNTCNTVFYFQKLFAALSGCPIWSWFFRFNYVEHTCTHTHDQKNDNGEIINSAFRWPGTQSTTVWGWKESISTLWPVASVFL